MELELVPVVEGDLEAVHHLHRRWETHWGVPEVTPMEVLRSDLLASHIDLDSDTRGVWQDGELVAFGYVNHHESGERLERAVLDGRVDPARRGLGIGRRLLAWQIERAVEKLRDCDPELPWYVRTYEWEWITDAHRLYRRFSMRPVRWFEEMIRPLSLPLETPALEGVEVIPWSQVPAEEARRVANESFADHWGSVPRDGESWDKWVSYPGMRHDLSFVAVAGSEVIGICLNAHWPENQQISDRLEGWIVQLGVLGEWRRRGVAASLIAASLEAFRQAGYSHAGINVDADSPTGASRLYRRLGSPPSIVSSPVSSTSLPQETASPTDRRASAPRDPALCHTL